MVYNDEGKEMVYVNIKYSGYIPEANIYGPMKRTFMVIDTLKELIDCGYDIELAYPDRYPEFSAQFYAYKMEMERQRRENQAAIKRSVIDEDQSSLVNRIAKRVTSQIKTQEYIDPSKANIGESIVARLNKQTADEAMQYTEEDVNLMNSYNEQLERLKFLANKQDQETLF